jgi:uncharacterized protein (DUF2384 family)
MDRDIPSDIHQALLEVYTEEGARIWWTSPNRMLDGKSAEQIAQTEPGRRKVLGLAQVLADGAFY